MYWWWWRWWSWYRFVFLFFCFRLSAISTLLDNKNLSLYFQEILWRYDLVTRNNRLNFVLGSDKECQKLEARILAVFVTFLVVTVCYSRLSRLKSAKVYANICYCIIVYVCMLRGLKRPLERLLAGLLETDDRSRWSYDAFFREALALTSQPPVCVFCLPTASIDRLYISSLNITWVLQCVITCRLWLLWCAHISQIYVFVTFIFLHFYICNFVHYFVCVFSLAAYSLLLLYCLVSLYVSLNAWDCLRRTSLIWPVVHQVKSYAYVKLNKMNGATK